MLNKKINNFLFIKIRVQIRSFKIKKANEKSERLFNLLIFNLLFFLGDQSFARIFAVRFDILNNIIFAFRNTLLVFQSRF